MIRKLLLTLVISGASIPTLSNPDVTSREYKLMLDANLFENNSEISDVTSFLTAAKSTIESAISRDVTSSPSLAKIRDVYFYDTLNSCELNTNGYAFRERVESGSSEVTLKFRSPDRYISDFEDLSASSSQAETKLEADVGINSVSQFKVVYAHSTTTPNTRTINNFKDINVHFPGFEDDYDYSDSLALDLVGNLSIREHVYKGIEIDLGSFDAKLSVTLWYNGVPTGSQKPVVAEVSFKYEDIDADYSKKVVNRAQEAFYALQGMTAWTNPASKTKTRFVYDYDPTFCAP